MDSGTQRTGTKSTGWLFASQLVLIGFFSSILYTLPRFAKVYAEMMPGEPLPVLTRLVCTIPLTVYAGLMVGAVVFFVWLHFRLREPRLCRCVNLAVIWFIWTFQLRSAQMRRQQK